MASRSAQFKMVPNAGADVVAKFGPLDGKFCPRPMADLEQWLHWIKPPAAPVVRIHCGWVPRIADAEIVVPMAMPQHFSRDRPRPHARLPYLRVQAAYFRRICGLNAADPLPSGVEMARIHDVCFDYDQRVQSHAKTSKGLRRYVALGDELWAKLGAWPWAAFDGPLPENWRETDEACSSLDRWHRAGVRATVEAAEAAVRTASEAVREAARAASEAEQRARWKKAA